MVKTLMLFSLLLLNSINIFGQDFSISPYVNYHIPIGSQTVPDYFTSVDNRSFFRVAKYLEDFPLEKGFRYGLGLDYTFKKNIGIGVNFDYAQSNKSTSFEGISIVTMDEYQYWSFQTFNIKPKLVFSERYNKFTFVFQTGPVVSFSQLEIIRWFEDDYVKYQFDMNPGYGYFLGIKIDYALNDIISESLENGIESTYYKPRSAKVTDTNLSTYDSWTTKQKEIDFYDRLDEIPSYRYWSYTYGNSLPSYETERDEPAKHLLEVLKLNSYYVGLSLSFKI